MEALSPQQVRFLRLRSQRLFPDPTRPASNAAQVVKELCGLQAQDLPSARLAVRARSSRLTAQEVKQTREEDRSIVLTWGMRGTLHLLPADDLSWLLSFFGPVFIRKSQRRYDQLGLDQETRTQAARAMRDILSERGPLTRPELARILADKGIPVKGQAIAHLVRYAALKGVICFGPQREGQLTYVPLEDWIHPGAPLDPEQAPAELARRYLGAYGPATPEDFGSWSGMTISQARTGFEAIANELLEVKAWDSPVWMLRQHSEWLDEAFDNPVVHLLPRFDEYLLGYQSRDFMVSDNHARRIHPGGGIIKPTLIVDGRAVGVWRSKPKKGLRTIVVEPFGTLSEVITRGLEAEVRDIGRFWQQETRLQLEQI